jgi:hypothetical protein
MPATIGANGQEAREDDGLAAMLLVEGVRALQVALVEPDRVFALEHLRADPSAERVADAVADDGGDGAQDAQRPDVEQALRGQEAGGEEQAVTRQEEAKEQARFGKHDERDADEAGPLDQGADV